MKVRLPDVIMVAMKTAVAFVMTKIRARAAVGAASNALILAVFGVLFTGAASAASAEEKQAQDYLQAAVRGNAEGMLGFYHPKEITDLRARVLAVLEPEAAAGNSLVRARLFGSVTTLAEVQRLTPDNLYLKVAARIGLPTEQMKEIKALGSIEENPGKDKLQLMHVVARLTPPDIAGARSRVTVVTFIRYGKGWRVMLPHGFQAKVDELLSSKPNATPEEQAAAQTAQSVPNTTGIDLLLDSSIRLLREGECAEYFNDSMSPKFRADTSAAALKRLIADCERSVDSRETYIAALQLARTSPPKYEQNGARAIYDLSGKGLPFQRFVLEKIEHRWYVAE